MNPLAKSRILFSSVYLYSCRTRKAKSVVWLHSVNKGDFNMKRNIL